MVYVLLYVVIGSNGGMMTGSVEFASQAACSTARQQLGTAISSAAAQAHQGGIGVQSACLNKATGQQ